MVALLVDELGASPSAVDRWGGTPLDDAIRSGHARIALFLTERGASKGLTAGTKPSSGVCEAAANGDVDQLRFFVDEQDADPNEGDYDSRVNIC